ncbi:hypothetical protein CEXT_796811 [Caerostris extrusa]|uniref:Uncharacterized protein n=1 Tax=Caerostris extrusa TaxID=172846 RepID=A0AAV4X953_CAEEX|nr:hypothetical protein CEXT_796811 [Caerostris extrusa]
MELPDLTIECLSKRKRNIISNPVPSATRWKCQPYWPSVSPDVSLLQVKIWNSNTEPLPSLPNDSGNGNAVPENQHFCMPAISENRTEDLKDVCPVPRFRDSVPSLCKKKIYEEKNNNIRKQENVIDLRVQRSSANYAPG